MTQESTERSETMERSKTSAEPSWKTLWDFAGNLADRWGLGVVLLVAAFYVVRADIILPLITSHSMFLERTLREQEKQTELLQEIRERIQRAQ